MSPNNDGAENVDLVPLLGVARVTVVAGKGGVGKTTVTAVLATAAAAAGRRVLAVELDGKPVLATLLGDIDHLGLSAKLALEEYLRDHGFGRVAKRLAASGVIDVVSTAAPGIDDIVVLGKIKQLERSGDYDVIVVDGPAAGHAVTMLTSASGLRDAVTSGPVRAQADEVLEMLQVPTRLQVALVTSPETTPVNETVETAFRLEDLVGVRLAPVIVNGVDVGPAGDGASVPSLLTGRLTGRLEHLDVDGSDRDDLAAAAAFRDERRAVQRDAIAQLAAALPLEQIHVPLSGTALDLAAVARLAERATAPSAGRVGVA